MDIDLSPIILEQMYIVFSWETGLQVASTYISGLNFQTDRVVEDLDLAKIPSLPSTAKRKIQEEGKTCLFISLSKG